MSLIRFLSFQNFLSASNISAFVTFIQAIFPPLRQHFLSFSKFPLPFHHFQFFPFPYFIKISVVSASPTSFGFSYSHILVRFPPFQQSPFFGEISSVFPSFPIFPISVYHQDFCHFYFFSSFPISAFQQDALLTFPSFSEMFYDFSGHFRLFLFPYVIGISAISAFPLFPTFPPFSLALFPYFRSIPISVF